MAIEIKEEWYPMPLQLGPPLPRSMQVYWPWVKRPPEVELPVPAPPIPKPPLAPPTPKYRLYVYTVGKGTVTPVDGEYPAGSVITLTAKPGYGAAFDRWVGDAAGTSPMFNITMDRNKSATAYFKAVTPPPYEEVPPPEEMPPAPPAPPPKADIRNLAFVATKGTYDIGDRVPFTATYEYKGRAQGGQIVISLGTGVYPTFSPVVNYSPMAVGFAEAMDWTSRSFEGTFLLNEALKPGQLYNTQAKLQTLEDPTQIIDTDWGVIRIAEVAPPPPAPPAAARFYMPARLNVKAEPMGSDYYRVTFSTQITNRGDATGREQLTWWANYLTCPQAIREQEEEHSRIIELGPGESHEWSWAYDEVPDYYFGYFKCWLEGDWEGDNSSVGTFTKEVAPPLPLAPAKEYTLTATVSPGGTGNVTGAGTYTAGTYATLTATPASGYEFDHWGGDASGTSPSIRILMDRGKRAIAYFKKKAVLAYKLSILVRPMAAGWVTKEPDKASYSYGETVKLTARTAPGYRFSSWTVNGEWAGYSTTLTLMVTKDLEVYAHFAEVS